MLAASNTKIGNSVGPQASRFNPELLKKGKKYVFKGGAENSKNDIICKNRYQQIAVTALGIVNSTSSGNRILDSTPENFTMTLEIATTDFFSGALSSFSLNLIFVSILVLSTIVN
jgi:hypothetical protein